MLLRRFGETVTLETRDGTTIDVPHVLVHEADQSDQTVQDVQTRFINQARYKGDQRTITLVWPKSAEHDLMDCHVWVRGERYAVYAAPFPIAHPPVEYDMMVTATRSLYLYDVDLLKSVLTRDEYAVQHVTWDPHPVKANLLRLAEDDATVRVSSGKSRIVMFEFRAEDWGDGYEACEYEGHVYHHKSTGIARDAVLCTFEGGVADA